MKRIIASTTGVFGAAFLWLASFKIVALWLGPTGVAIFSQFRQMIQAATMLASPGGTNALVQGISERVESAERQRFRNSVSRVMLVMGVLTAAVMILLAHALAVLIFDEEAAELVTGIRLLGVAVLFSVGTMYTMGVLNGHHALGRLAMVQLVGPGVMLLFLGYLFATHNEGSSTVLAVTFVASFGLSFLLGLFYLLRMLPEARRNAAGVLPRAELHEFLKLAFSMTVAASSGTIALLMVRALVIQSFGLARAGLFDSAWTLSFNYITLFLSACSTLVLPTLTRAAVGEARRAYLYQSAHFVLAGVVGVCYLVMVFKLQLLALLYSQAFVPAANFLGFLLLAILLRAVAWVYGLMMVAAKRSRVILLSELSFNVLSLLASWGAIRYWGTNESLALALVLSNMANLLFVLFYMRRMDRQAPLLSIVGLLVLAAVPLALAAVYEMQTGQFMDIRSWSTSVPFLLFGGALALFALMRCRRGLPAHSL